MSLFAGEAMGTIANSPHDLSVDNGTAVTVAWSGGAANQRICAFCHTPHKAYSTGEEATLPLWNKTLPTTNAFTAYGNPNGTIEAAVLPLPTVLSSASFACFGCHDGATALDAIKNIPRGWDTNPGVEADFAGDSVDNATDTLDPATSPFVLGDDLDFEHPIGIDYSASQGTDGELIAETAGSPITVGADALILFGAQGTLECGTCHDVHNNDNPPFLAADNQDSDLCFNCHDK
jgi:predicted CXXCH cytochrome family protein